MAKRPLSQEDLDAIVQLARKWEKIVCRQAFGEEGPGLEVDFTQMEDVAVAAMRGLLAGTACTAPRPQSQLAPKRSMVISRFRGMGGSPLVTGHGNLGLLTRPGFSEPRIFP